MQPIIDSLKVGGVMKRDSLASKIAKRQIDGILLLDKAPGLSSNAALQAVKRLLRARKAGHTGTLDPMATGLLPICLGEATKFAGTLLEADKCYLATLKLGVVTSTGDSEGQIVECRSAANITRDEVTHALAGFVGPLTQVPPMHSALKLHGKPLYSYARAGISIPREPRNITVHSLAFDDLRDEELVIRVSCSKGTYVRVLAEDIGRALGCGASLRALRRTAIADIGVAEAWTLQALGGLPDAHLLSLIKPTDSMLKSLFELRLSRVEGESIRCGRSIPFSCERNGELVRLYDSVGIFLGIGELSAGMLVPKRLVAH
jgi:tRNA pseudouridine55 synthase